MPPLSFCFWLALIWGAGWLFFPFSRRLFADLPDGGLAVGRVLFLAVWTLVAFWAGNLGVPTQISAFFWLVLAAAGLFFAFRTQTQLRAEIQNRRRAIVSAEAIFLLVFLGFFVLRGFWSDTNGTNGEKSMDSALIGSLVRAQRLPPPNPYAAGAKLQSYYLFGHLETALLTRAIGSTPRWTYNLMCATLPALCFSVMFSLGAALTASLRGGIFVAATILCLGTLQPIFQWLYPGSFGLNPPFRLDFFAVSRVIPFSINEFPWFTFQQADLHAHYFDFPFALATICLAYAIFRGCKAAVGAAILVLAAQILTNTWDFPAYGLVVGLACLSFKNFSQDYASLSPQGKKIRQLVLFAVAIVVVVAALILAAPYLLGIKTAATPPQKLPQPASPLREWLLLWGVCAAAWWAFLAFSLWESRAARAVILLFGVAVLGLAWQSPWSARPYPYAASPWVLPLVGVTLLFSVWGAVKLRDEARFLCFLAVAGLVALAWSETTWAGFLGDRNNPNFDDYKRQDTVFKFGLQTWMLWCLAAACGAWRTQNRWPIWLKTAFLPAFGVMAVASISVIFGRTRNFEKWDGWDGWAHLAPPQQEAAAWLGQNTPRGQHLLEAEDAQGGDYSPYTRYAHATGIPTIIGPQAHSFQWSPANSGDAALEWAEVYRRKADARAIYTSGDAVARRALLRKYQVRFIVFGDLERFQYGDAALEKLRLELPLAAQFGAPDDAASVQIFENTPAR